MRLINQLNLNFRTITLHKMKPRYKLLFLAFFAWTSWVYALAQTSTVNLSTFALPAQHIIPEHPRVFFSPDLVAALQTRQQKPEQQAILSQMDLLLKKQPDPIFVASYAAAYFFKNQLNPQKSFVDSALKYIRYTLTDRYLFEVTDEDYQGQNPLPLWNSNYKAIYKAPNLLALALAYDIGFNFIPDSLRTHMALQLERKSIELVKGQTAGFNTNPWSNWQGIANGAAGVALLATSGDKGTTPVSKTWLDSALVRSVLHLDWLGDKSWSAEGFDYLRFEMSAGVLPLALAYKNMFGTVLPGSSKLEELAKLYALISVKSDTSVVTAGYGNGGNYWNTNRWRSGGWVMSLGLAKPETLPVAQGGFDLVFGLKGDKTFNLFKPHDAIFAYLFYPQKAAFLKPGNGPYFFADEKAGFYLFRSTIGTGNDILFSTTANMLAKNKAHSFRDAGSFRLIAHGKVIAGRKEKSNKKPEDASLENVVNVLGATNWNPAKVNKFETDNATRMHVEFDMTPVYQAGSKVGEQKNIGIYQAKRIIKLNFQPGLDVVVNIADSLQGGGTHCWRLHTNWRTWFNGSDRFRARQGGTPAFEGGVMEMCNPKEGVYQVMLRVEDE